MKFFAIAAVAASLAFAPVAHADGAITDEDIANIASSQAKTICDNENRFFNGDPANDAGVTLALVQIVYQSTNGELGVEDSAKVVALATIHSCSWNMSSLVNAVEWLDANVNHRTQLA